METFKNFIIQYWPDIVNVFALVVSYFLVFLFRYSTRNLNGSLKTTFKENTDTIAESNKLFEAKVEYALKEARSEYVAAVKRCEEYQKEVDHLKQALSVFLSEGGE